MEKLILASSSPSRRQLLERLGVPFGLVAPTVDERAVGAGVSDPRELAQTLARHKAWEVSARHPQAVVVGGDQVVHCEGEILGKPGGRARAREQLLALQGREHHLITAVCIYCEGERRVEWAQEDRLSMRPLTPEHIQRYLQWEDVLHCAGSYRIEGGGIALFDHIASRDTTAIMGLPLMALSRELEALGFELWGVR